MIVCGKEFSTKNIAMIEDIIAENRQISRVQLSRQVCKALNWRSENGRLKEMSCRVAVLRMHRQGIIKLPQVHQRPCFKAKGGEGKQRITDIAEIRSDLSELGEIEIIRIDSRYSKTHQIWKELMNRYHYLGSGCLCGHQMRYLIRTKDYGYLGGFAFSSAAWRLQGRDQWIGWDDSARKTKSSISIFGAS